MVIKCEECGASLDAPDDGGAFVDCEYCGTLIQLKPVEQPQVSNAPDIHESLADLASVSQDMHLFQPRRPKKKSKSGCSAFIGLLVVVGIGALVWYQFKGFSDAIKDAVQSGNSNTSVHMVSHPCLIDFDDDKIKDVVGLIDKRSAKGRRLAVVSGANGQILWEHKTAHKSPRMVCIGQGAVLVTLPTFTAYLHTKGQFDSPRMLSLPNRVRSFGLGSNAEGKPCIGISFSRKIKRGYLWDGTETTCEPKEWSWSRLAPGMVGSGVAHVFDYLKSFGYVVKVENTQEGVVGTTVSAWKDGQQVWKVPLRYRGNSSDLAAVQTPQNVVIWGVVPGTDSNGQSTLIGVDPRNGTVRYEKAISGESGSQSFGSISYNGRYVIVRSVFGMAAFEPTNGDEIWYVGTSR